MIVSDLKYFFKDFCKETLQPKAILVDGRRGCGKTYNTKQFIRDNKANAIYLSLFGINNCSEIVLKLSEYLDSTYIVQIDNHFLLKDIFNDCEYNNVIVVFDDLERIESSIGYSEVFSLVDKLKRLGFMVICICDSLGIDDSGFNEFKEKTFDDIIEVESDNSLISTITGLEINIEESLLKTVNHNWRIIQKGKIYYDSICEEFQKNNCDFSEAMNFSNDILFRCIVLATKCVYSNRTNHDELNDDYQKITYEDDEKKYGTFVANELNFLFSEGKENSNLKKLVRLFISAIKNHDYYSIVLYSKPIVNDSLLDKYPYNKEIFYLDDETYTEYKERFLQDINEFDFSNKNQLRILESVINNYYDDLKDDEMELIIKRMLLTMDSIKINIFIERLNILQTDTSFKINKFKTKLAEELLKHNDNLLCEKIKNSIDEKDYDTLTSILFDNRWASDEKKGIILNVFKGKSYGLPNLAKEIDNSSWTYCHEIAKYVSNTAYENSFIQCLKEQCSKSNSLQLRRRCKALTKYNLNKDIDFD